MSVSLCTASGQRACEAGMSDLHAPLPTLGQINSGGKSRQRCLLTWYLSTAFSHHFPFDFALPIFGSPLPQNNKADQETVTGKYFVCICHKQGTVLGARNPTLKKANMVPVFMKLLSPGVRHYLFQVINYKSTQTVGKEKRGVLWST